MILSNSRTLLEDLEAAKKNGYDKEFYFRNDKITCRESKLTYTKNDCSLAESCIHEGLSDPSDQSILFLIQCKDETKGCLVSGYGTYADSELIEFCISLPKIE
jgi:hypothetical protein